ncbi:MAG: YceI family protein [Myxococcota bacterium]
MRPIHLLSSAAVLALATPLVVAEPVVLQVDHSQSFVVARTGVEGALRTLGHEHGILATAWSADITFDAENAAATRVQVSVPVRELRIDTPDALQRAGLTKGPSEKDVRKLQDTMVNRFLEASEHPTITFRTTEVVVEGPEQVVLVGPLTLHGHTQTVRIPARVQSIADGGVQVEGSFTIRQTDYGIQPESILGVVRVSDPVRIRFSVTARPTSVKAEAG